MNVTRLIRPPCKDAPTPLILHRKGSPSPWSSLLSEEFSDLLHPRPGTGAMSFAVGLADRLELAKQLPLSVGETDRRFDDDRGRADRRVHGCARRECPCLAAGKPFQIGSRRGF